MFKRLILPFTAIVLAYQPTSAQPLNFNNKTGNNLIYLMQQEQGKAKIKLFMDNVLRQFDSEAFLKMMAQFQDQPALTNAEVYQTLQKEFIANRPWFYFATKLSALKAQQQELGQQISSALADTAPINSYVEIGTPGTYIHSINATNPIAHATVINDTQSLGDYAHGFSWNPFKGFKVYDEFVFLKDYAPIREKRIASNSVDVVSCVIGLHHVPTEKLNGFISSIYRILKPGGIFILRDHDTYDDEVKAIAQAAHSVFNIASAEIDFIDEMAEYRNFQPLSYWVKHLEKVGFVDKGVRLLQQGDPTLNTLMAFEKPIHSLTEIEQSLENNADYIRDGKHTYLTSPEWQNVLAAKEYARFIQHTPFYEFPYMRAVSSYWDVFGKSWNAARKDHTFFDVLTSDYTFMNLFVGVFMTIEYSLKALISAPIRFFIGGEEPRHIQLLIEDPLHQAQRLHKDLKVIKEFKDTPVKVVEVPRYKEFKKVIRALEHYPDLRIINIAGNKEIQVTIKYTKTAPPNFAEAKGIHQRYEWEFPTLEDVKFAAVVVDTSSLRDFISLARINGVEIVTIHDY